MLYSLISRAFTLFNVVATSANKTFSLSFVRPLSAKVKMFCQGVALKKSIAKLSIFFLEKKSIVESVYFFGSLDRLFLRANFAYQMRRKIVQCACVRFNACAYNSL